MKIFLKKVFIPLFTTIFFAAHTLSAEFVVYDAMQLRNKPDLTHYGFEPIGMTYESRFWRPYASRDQLDIPWLQRYSKSIVEGPITYCLDVELWDLNAEDTAEVSANVGKLLTILEQSRAHNPDKKFGYYGIIPIRDYWSPINGKQKLIAKWQKQNTRIKELADAVDIIFPSLYTFYNNQEDWVEYAIANINEAKKYGKPVVAFLWPQYHGSNFLRKFDYIDGEFWRLQLETVKQHADGVVIWSPRGEPMGRDWDENEEWWRQTKSFMKTQGFFKKPIRRAELLVE